MSRIIAFFDFDGTITRKDTLLEIFRYLKGNIKFLLGFFINSPFLVAYKLQIISNQSAKERLLRYFFGKISMEKFQQDADQFAENVIPYLVRPKAMKEIEKLKAAGAEVVIVSASVENWIRKWSEANGIILIATRLEVSDGKITGKICGYNCHGDEKVRRIREAFDLSSYDTIYCYGDRNSDKPLLSLATISFYKPFR